MHRIFVEQNIKDRFCIYWKMQISCFFLFLYFQDAASNCFMQENSCIAFKLGIPIIPGNYTISAIFKTETENIRSSLLFQPVEDSLFVVL